MNKTTVIVTGASGGIGSAIVKSFLKNDFLVVGIDRVKCDLTHQNYQHIECDLTNLEKLKYTINDVFFTENNVLINCAGIREICSIGDLSIEKWHEVFTINVTTVFVAAQAFAEKIKSLALNKGCIINIASVSGILGEPDRTAYVSSKHALIGLTKQLAIEYGKFGIRANAIAPGVIRTPLTEGYYDDVEQMEKIVSGQFMDYLATPDDIAPLASFLASDASRFMTGSIIAVDGGWTSGKCI